MQARGAMGDQELELPRTQESHAEGGTRPRWGLPVAGWLGDMEGLEKRLYPAAEWGRVL